MQKPAKKSTRAPDVLRSLLRLRPASETFGLLFDNLANTGRGRKQILGVSADMVLVVFALWSAYSVRYGIVFGDFMHTWHLFAALPLLTVLLFASLGVYRWVVRSSNTRLVGRIVQGCVVSALALVLLAYLFPPDRTSNPRSLFLLYGMFLLVGTIGIRLAWQWMFDSGNRGQPIAIYGTGHTGRQLAALLDLSKDYRPVALIDDDSSVIGSTLSGLPVLDGSSERLEVDLKKLEVCQIVLAMPSLEPDEYRRKLESLEPFGIPVKTVPSISELMSGIASADEIRDISINDILGRREVAPDPSLLGKRVHGRTVLVTGGGGSIGSELCRQIVSQNPRKLIVLDNCEANLYHITEELGSKGGQVRTPEGDRFRAVLASVCDAARVNALIEEEGVQTIYHAAAYKHVPIIEAHPEQGVEVNVFGTLTVLDAAVAHGVSDFVLISTDKAVRPKNSMGASKRVAELVLQAKARQGVSTRVSMVRFGNVLGSSGSVVPKFKQQIEGGGPITLTHPDITRYFMTIPEAAQLVLQASAIAQGGDVFVLDMGEPVRIEQLATSMVKLYGKRLKRETGREGDIEIVIEGLRPGEKMYEELFIADSCQLTAIPKVFTAAETSICWTVLAIELKAIRSAVDSGDRERLRELLMKLAFDDGTPERDARGEMLSFEEDAETRRVAAAHI